MLVRASSSCDVADSRLAMSMHFDEHELPPLAQLLADDRRRFRVAAVLVELLLEQRAVDREIRVDGQHVVARVIAGGLVVQVVGRRALGEPQCLRVAQRDLAHPRRMLRAPRAPHFTGVGRSRCELRSCVSEVPWSSGVGIAVARPHLVVDPRAARGAVRAVARCGSPRDLQPRDDRLADASPARGHDAAARLAAKAVQRRALQLDDRRGHLRGEVLAPALPGQRFAMKLQRDPRDVLRQPRCDPRRILNMPPRR